MKCFQDMAIDVSRSIFLMYDYKGTLCYIRIWSILEHAIFTNEVLDWLLGAKLLENSGTQWYSPDRLCDEAWKVCWGF